jgi:hypothetical protein
MKVPSQSSEPDRDKAIAAIGSNLEDLRRRAETTEQEIAKILRLTAEFGERLAAAVPASRVGPISWLGFPCHTDDPTAPTRAEAVLTDLGKWVSDILLHFPDVVVTLPSCWLWHPDVVEELLWLRQAWAAAYRGPAPSVLAIGDWHDRSRPGVLRRIRAVAATCSIETHTCEDDAGFHIVRTLLADAPKAIAHWWTTDRDGPAPEPMVPVADSRRQSR